MKQTRLIPIIIVAIMLFNCFMPFTTVFANSSNSIQLNSKLYDAIKIKLTENNINASFNDKQRKVTISQEELSKVTFLDLENCEIDDLTGLEKFTSLVELDLSSNELTKDSNLGVLSSLNLRKLDLSTNMIEDVSSITNLDSIAEVNLHSQNFSRTYIISKENVDENGEMAIGQLPEILSVAGNLRPEWVNVKKDYEGNPSGLKLDFTKLYNENTISLRIPGEFNEDGEFNPDTGLLKLEIDVTDTTNIISESKMEIFYLVLGNDQRAGVFKDANLYNVIKKQLTHGENDFNDDLRTYVDGEDGETLYERAYDEPMILVFNIDELMNEISTLKVSNSQVKDLSGIEIFVGLRNELDVSYNYIDSIEKIIELQKNKENEELKLQERFKEQIAKLNKARAEFMECYTKVQELDKQIQDALDSVENLNNYIEELTAKLNDTSLKENEIKSIQGEITQKKKELGIGTDNEGNIIPGLMQKVNRELNGYVNEKGENVLGLYAKRDEAAKRAKQALPSIYPEFEKLNNIYKDDYKALTLLPHDVDKITTDAELLVAMNEKIKKYEAGKNLSEMETVLITGYLADYGIEIEYTDIDGNKIENPISSTISKLIENGKNIYEAKMAILEVDSIIQCINYLVLNHIDDNLAESEYEQVLNKKIEKIIEEKENGISSFGYLSIRFDSYSVPTSKLYWLQQDLDNLEKKLEDLNNSAEAAPEPVAEPSEALGEKPTIEEGVDLPETEPQRDSYQTDEEFNSAMELWKKKVALDKWTELNDKWTEYDNYLAAKKEYDEAEAKRQNEIAECEKQINELLIEIVKEIRLNNKKYYIIETFKSLKEEFKKLENNSESVEISDEAVSYLVSASGKFVSLTEEEIKEYVQLPKLKVVNITNNIIETLEGIEELADLKELYAGENEISDLTNVKWDNMKKLEILDLHFNMISNIKALEVITSLEKLNVSNNLLSGYFNFNIIGLPKIYSLDFSNNQYTDIEEVIKQFEWIAKTYEDTLEDYLIKSEFDIKFHNQRISIPVGTFIVKDGESVIQNVKLPSIIKQLEELDSRKTVFGTESIYGKVRNDGTVGLMISNEEGKHAGKVTVLTKEDEYGYSIGHGTTVTLNYEVMNSKVDNVEVNNGTENNFAGEVELGKTMQFNAGVDGTNVEDTSVTWSMKKIDENGKEITLENKTNINKETGLLTVDPEETAKVIKVTATSNYDSSKTATVEVKVIKLKTTVVVTPSTTEKGLEQGSTKTYAATVETEAEDKTVTWSIEGNTSENTKIENGVLTIGEDEAVGTKIVVKATSNYDDTKSATVEETIIEKVKEVEIKINETATQEGLEQGATKTYTVTVETEAEDKTVTWSIEGATSKNTKIENGVLTIGEDEKAGTKVTVKVTSNYDNTKSATVEETVIENKVELNKPSNETTVFEQTPGATVNSFVDGLVASGNTVKVLDREGKEVSNTAKLATGMKVVVNDKDSYTIVVTGDINGDGKVSDFDSNLIKAFRIGAQSLSDVEKQAADVNADGKVNRIDSFIMLLYRAGSKEVRDFTPETIENIMK